MVAFLVVLSGCGPAAGDHSSAMPKPGPTGRVVEQPKPWEGPPATVELEVMESLPQQFAVTLRVQAPSGGFRLRAIGVPLTIRERLSPVDGAAKPARGGLGKRFGQPVRTDVRFELTLPPANVPAITVIEECSVRVDLGSEVAFPIRVLLRRSGEEAFEQVGDEIVR